MPPRQSEMTKVSARRGRSVGRWLGGVGNIGLALCRLEMMTDIRLTEETPPYDPKQEFKIVWNENMDNGGSTELRVKAFVPRWMRVGIEERLHSLRGHRP
jgi:hypothetical protein